MGPQVTVVKQRSFSCSGAMFWSHLRYKIKNCSFTGCLESIRARSEVGRFLIKFPSLIQFRIFHPTIDIKIILIDSFVIIYA